MEGPARAERQVVAQRAEVEDLDPLEAEVPHLLAKPLHDRDLQVEIEPPLVDPRQPHLGLAVALQRIKGPDVLEVPLQLAVDQAAAPQVEQAASGGRHQLGQPLVAERLVAGEVDLFEGGLGTGIDPPGSASGRPPPAGPPTRSSR